MLSSKQIPIFMFVLVMAVTLVIWTIETKEDDAGTQDQPSDTGYNSYLDLPIEELLKVVVINYGDGAGEYRNRNIEIVWERLLTTGVNCVS